MNKITYYVAMGITAGVMIGSATGAVITAEVMDARASDFATPTSCLAAVDRAEDMRALDGDIRATAAPMGELIGSAFEAGYTSDMDAADAIIAKMKDSSARLEELAADFERASDRFDLAAKACRAS